MTIVNEPWVLTIMFHFVSLLYSFYRSKHIYSPTHRPDRPNTHQCSVSCGAGIQVRKIECADAFGAPSTACDIKMKPSATQPCSTGISCANSVSTVAAIAASVSTPTSFRAKAIAAAAEAAAGSSTFMPTIGQKHLTEKAFGNSEVFMISIIYLLLF